MTEFISGALSGIIQSCVGHPFDTYKIRLQNNQKNIFNINPFRGICYPMQSAIFNCVITFGLNSKVSSYGIDEIFSGCISGAAISPIVYVSDNYKIHRQLSNNMKPPPQLIELWYKRGKTSTFLRESCAFAIYFKSFTIVDNYINNAFISGGIAGLCNWTATYPLDVIRNREIAQNINFKKALSLGNLWKGYGFCAFRAVKVNAVGFFVYDYCTKILKK